jgi:hypothetical protein
MDPIDQKLSRFGMNNSTQLIQNILLASTELTPQPNDDNDPDELSK